MIGQKTEQHGGLNVQRINRESTNLCLARHLVLFERNLDFARLLRRSVTIPPRTWAHVPPYLHIVSVQLQHLLVVPAHGQFSNRRRSCSSRLRRQAQPGGAYCCNVLLICCTYTSFNCSSRRQSNYNQTTATRPLARTCSSRCRHTASLRNSVS